jgi:hypothetical protein
MAGGGSSRDGVDQRYADLARRVGSVESEWAARGEIVVVCNTCGVEYIGDPGIPCPLCALRNRIRALEGCAAADGAPYTPEQIDLAARRYVDVFGEFGREGCGSEGYRYTGSLPCSHLPGSVSSVRVRADTVTLAFAEMVVELAADPCIDWVECERIRSGTGRGVPLFAPPEEWPTD